MDGLYFYDNLVCSIVQKPKCMSIDSMEQEDNSVIIIGETKYNIANLPNGTVWSCVEGHFLFEFERIAYHCP